MEIPKATQRFYAFTHQSNTVRKIGQTLVSRLLFKDIWKRTQTKIFGVITPYRNQREILTKTVKKIGLSPETVLTVHGAQGREWDTVLFSVVDTDGKWFTTTLIPKSNGTQIINTAVSRAKKKLILVCDCEYWSRQSNELIGKLLQIHPSESPTHSSSPCVGDFWCSDFQTALHNLAGGFLVLIEGVCIDSNSQTQLQTGASISLYKIACAEKMKCHAKYR